MSPSTAAPARRRLTLSQALLTAGLVAVVGATPLLMLVEYAGLAGTADSFGIAQDVTGNLADAQRDALLTVIAVDEVADGTRTPASAQEQVAFLRQQLRILESDDFAADVQDRIATAATAAESLEAELAELADRRAEEAAPPPGEHDPAVDLIEADADIVAQQLRGLYSQFENSYFRGLSGQLRTRRDHELLILASAVLAVALGMVLARSLRRSVRGDFERAYELLERGTADRVAAQAAAELTSRRSQALVQHAVDSILVVDAEGRVTYANPAAADLIGRDVDALVGARLDDIASAETRGAASLALKRSLAAAGETLAFDLDLGAAGHTDAPGLPLEPDVVHVVAVRLTNLLADPAVAGIVVNANDVTERTRHARELERLAYHDRLTGLGNRLRLEQHIGWLSGGRTRATVLVLDVDQLGTVNDRYGADTGDALLRALAQRLVDGLRPDTVYHLGGDEFAVLSPGTADAETRDGLVARVREVLAVPVELDGATLDVSAGIGVAAADLTAVRGPALLRLADAAMHDAKALGSDRVVVMDEARAQEAEDLALLTEGLAHALERDELEVWYQPIVLPHDRSWVTVEALLRWRRPQGLVSPAAFIPAAEMSGLILPIGRWVLLTALRDLARMRAETGLPLLVNVNVAASQLHDPGFVEEVLGLVRDTGLEPSALVLELTESAVLEDPERAIRVLAQARASGMHVALDDFGTGYSSLSYLQRLPVSSVKVDRSFLEDVETSARTRQLLTAVVAIAHDLDLSVTIEGVETEETMGLVAAAGCDTVQGFLVARPMPVADLLRLALAPSVEVA